MLVWGESGADGRLRLWTASLRDTAAPRLLTADTGQARFYQSPYDLVLAQGRVHWVADAPGGPRSARWR